MSDDINVANISQSSADYTVGGKPSDTRKALEFESKKPDIKALVGAFKETRVWSDYFIQQCKRNADTRFCRWPGQTYDQRKHTNDLGKQAMPWEGASDMRFFFVDSYIKYLVAMIMASWRRARITANPSNNSFSDIRKAGRAASFIRWVANQIPDLYKQSEVALNYLFEKGMTVTYQCWMREIRKLDKCVKLGDFDSQVQQIVLTPEMEEMAIKIAKQYLHTPEFNATYDNKYEIDKDGNRKYIPAKEWSDDEIKEILIELRQTGESYMEVNTPIVDRAGLYALNPEEDIFFPTSTIDIQNAPYGFQVMYYTAHELRQKVESEGWDSAFVEQCIAEFVGKDNIFLAAGVRMDGTNNVWERLKNMVQLIHVWQKLTTKDGNVAIWETVIHPNTTERFGVHKLSPYNHGEYPFVVTKLEDYSKRLYESRGLPEVLKGTQDNIKAQFDAKIDRTNLTNLPPLLEVYTGLDAPGGYIAPASKYRIRSEGELTWMAPPVADPMGPEVIEALLIHADTIVGRPNEKIDPMESRNRQQMFHDKWAEHCQKVFKQLYSLYLQYGPDEVLFRASGSSEILQFKKDMSEVYDYNIALDSQGSDAELLKVKSEMVTQILPLDLGGKIDKSKLVSYLINAIDPAMADDVVSGEGDASQQSIKEEQSAIAAITSGLDVDIHPNEFNQTKAQYYSQWFQRPDIQHKLQQDPVVGQIAEKRMKQWQQQQIQFQVNSQTGKLGTNPGSGGEA